MGGDAVKFIASESNLAKNPINGNTDAVIVPLGNEGDATPGKTTSQMKEFTDRPVSLAVPRLIGCTSVIVVSKKGVWANHIWDAPIFRPEQDINEETYESTGKWLTPGFGFDLEVVEQFPRQAQLTFFQEHALQRLHTRYDPPDDEHISGLDDLRKAGGMFDEASEPRIFMFSPYVSIDDEKDPNYGVEHPQGLNAAWDRPGNPEPRADEGVAPFNEQIRAELRGIFGAETQIDTVLYAPDLDEDPEDVSFNLHRGRALIQFQPGDLSQCDPPSKAKWRIWFEGQTEPQDTVEWDPMDDPSQWCDPSAGTKRLRLRWKTPTGSSCASTATVSQCNMGACVPTSSCASWVATATPTSEPPPPPTQTEAPPQPTAPLEVNPVQCHDEKDFPGHADINPREQTIKAAVFCISEDLGYMGPTSARGPPVHLRTTDDSGTNYDWTIMWDAGCTVEGGLQSLKDPLGEDKNTCAEVMRGNYDKCPGNGGVGGRTKVGCLIYDFTGGRG
ncbi:hypothetical protein GCG54_00007278 [Colletotrichum gloeosporioides]|uniref:Uncharacterized protein n=1 Tax=Colletotrichum gloeosporioides TaxID=474922 RepID=A0A8H4CN60_COLGL|nr:uncharacterized protein GCG54_00007278 [Colletotrichum gloeosporioides]KAF3807023.1 hypothetical protein GCG54_00007278 [Colletotrichum gloeosporioides]